MAQGVWAQPILAHLHQKKGSLEEIEMVLLAFLVVMIYPLDTLIFSDSSFHICFCL